MFSALTSKLLKSGIDFVRGNDPARYENLLAFGHGRVCEMASWEDGYEIYLSNGFWRSDVSNEDDDVAEDMHMLVRSFLTGDFWLSSHRFWRRGFDRPGRGFNPRDPAFVTGPLRAWPTWFPTYPPGGIFCELFPWGRRWSHWGSDGWRRCRSSRRRGWSVPTMRSPSSHRGIR